MSTPPLIELRSITKSYNEQTVIDKLTLSINKGEFVTLLGPSGCGKTTLLRLIAGFDNPEQGDILLNGESILDKSPQQRPIHTVFQNYALFPHMTVFDNVAFSLSCQRVEATEIRQRVDKALEMVKLDHLSQRYPAELSGGQQQRVAIARAIINRPDVLLLDECLSALDTRLRQRMQIELKTLQQHLAISFIFITHSQEEALSMSDNIVVLNEGRIQQSGSPRELYEQPSNLMVADFMGATNVFYSQVDEVENNQLSAQIEGQTFHFSNDKGFNVNDPLHIIVRPEDLRVWSDAEKQHSDCNSIMLAGHIETVIYKGSTVDLVVKLDSGKRLFATEFFDEDDEELDYKINERVYAHWLNGWEVLLPYDN